MLSSAIEFLNTEKMVKNSFYLTYVFLLTTATITFIEAMRTKVEKVRHILNLETCISVVAAYFYGRFVEIADKGQIDYKQLNMTRYVDWFITTPIMLLVLCLAFLYNSGGRLRFTTFLKILAMNFAMLASGYAGSANIIDKVTALGIGVVFFFALYGFIYYKFIARNQFSIILFYIGPSLHFGFVMVCFIYRKINLKMWHTTISIYLLNVL